MRVDPGLFPYAPRVLEVDGQEIAYVDEGSGPPVVLVHGNPTWSFAFRTLIAGLVDTHRVIAVDHVGMGRSARPSPGTYDYTLDRRVRDLGAVIDRLVPTGALDLVLHDWGGAIGCGWATQHPDRVGRLMLLNTAAFPLPDGMRLPWLLRLARSPVGETLVRNLGAFNAGTILLGARRRLPAAVARGYLAPYRSRSDRHAVWAFVRDIPARESDPSWARLSAIAGSLDALRDHPVIICWGMKDPVFGPRLLEEWRQRLPRARIVRFPAAGHLVFEDAADAIVSIAREFFDPGCDEA